MGQHSYQGSSAWFSQRRALGSLVFALMVLGTALAITLHLPLASAQSPPVPIKVPITPCLISDPAATLALSERPRGGSDVALEQRQALLDAWNVIIQRNTIPAFNHALMNQPPLGASDSLAWRFSMVEYYRAPIDRALAAAKNGRAPFHEPLRSEGQKLSLIPANGAMVLAPQLFHWLLVQQELEDQDSLVPNLGQVLSVLDDWLEGEDTFFNLSNMLTKGLLDLAVESPGPNLGPALENSPSPYRLTRDRFSQRRHVFLFGGHYSLTLLESISDFAVPDVQVLEACQKILKETYQRQLQADVYLAPSLELWFESLERQADKHREYLISHRGLEQTVAAAMHPNRLAVVAAIAQYDAFAQFHEELLTLPVHEAVARWLNESSPPPEGRGIESWKPMGGLARSFCFPYFQEHWYSEQGMHAVSVVYYLRDYLARHGTLPVSLQDLPANNAVIDPITNQHFQYERTAPQNATLQLADYRGGSWRVWEIVGVAEPAK